MTLPSIPIHLLRRLELFVPVKVGPLSFASFPCDIAAHISDSKARAELLDRKLIIAEPRYGQGMFVLTEQGDRLVRSRIIGRNS